VADKCFGHPFSQTPAPVSFVNNNILNAAASTGKSMDFYQAPHTDYQTGVALHFSLPIKQEDMRPLQYIDELVHTQWACVGRELFQQPINGTKEMPRCVFFIFQRVKMFSLHVPSPAFSVFRKDPRLTLVLIYTMVNPVRSIPPLSVNESKGHWVCSAL